MELWVQPFLTFHQLFPSNIGVSVGSHAAQDRGQVASQARCGGGVGEAPQCDVVIESSDIANRSLLEQFL